MQPVMLRWRGQPLSRPSLAGHGLIERARSTAFALLGLTTALALALVAFIAQQEWSYLPSAPIVGPKAVAGSVHGRVAVATPARAEKSPAQVAPAATEPTGSRLPAGRGAVATEVGSPGQLPGGVPAGGGGEASPPPAVAPAPAGSNPQPASAAPDKAASAPAAPATASPATVTTTAPSSPPATASSPAASKGNGNGNAYGHETGNGNAEGRGNGNAYGREKQAAPPPSPPPSAPAEPPAAAPVAEAPEAGGPGNGHAYGRERK
jgi:hypothetical protein